MKLTQLFEASIIGTRFNKIWNNKQFQARLEGHGRDTQYADVFSYDSKYEDIDIQDILELPEFKEFYKDQIEIEFDNKFDEIFDHIRQGNITLYREMTVKKDWLSHLEKNPKSRLGKYWSYDSGAAEAHWGKFDNEHHKMTIVIEIKEKYVDWLETFEANILIEHENEITLFKNTQISIIRLLDDKGEEMDISSIENNTYRA